MEPQSPNFNQPPASPQKHEAYPLSSFENEQISNNETAQERSREVFHDNESHEKSKAPRQATSTTLPDIQTDGNDSTIPTSLPDPTSSTIANDDDVMEKVWVGKSKKIIESTKGDPYQREREVSKLQAEYIQKRYGKTIRLPEDS